MSNCGPVRRVRSCRIVSIGNGFGQPSGVVAVACGVTGGIGDADEVAASVVIVGGNPACGIVDGNRQVEGFVVVDLGTAAVRRGDGDDVAFGIVEIAGFASEGVAFYGNAAVAVAFAVAALSVGVDAVDEFAVFVETVHFRPPQCVGNDGMVFAVAERPFFAEVVAALEHFAVGVVTVVFVAGHQSVGLVVFDHDVAAVGETAQFFAVASVNSGQIAVAVVVVTHQFLAVEGDGGEAVDVETFVFGNEIVKEQMVQTTSKKIVRSSEKQKPRAYVPLVLYIRIKGFVQATASCGCYLFFRRPYGLVSRTDHSFTDKANLRPHHNFHLRFY